MVYPNPKGFLPLNKFLLCQHRNLIGRIVKKYREFNHWNRNRPSNESPVSFSYLTLRRLARTVSRFTASQEEILWNIGHWSYLFDTIEKKLKEKKEEEEREKKKIFYSSTARGKRIREEALVAEASTKAEIRLSYEPAAKRPQLTSKYEEEELNKLHNIVLTCCNIIFRNKKSLQYHKRFTCLKLPILYHCPVCLCLRNRPSNEIRVHLIHCTFDHSLYPSLYLYRCNDCLVSGMKPNIIYYKSQLSFARHLKDKHPDKGTTGLLLNQKHTCTNCNRVMTIEQAINHEFRCTTDYSEHVYICTICQINIDAGTFRFKQKGRYERHMRMTHATK